MLGFVHADPDRIEVGKSDISEEARSKLAAFRTKVQTRMCRTWSTPEELGGAVSRSLIQQMRQRPGIGWVRGDKAITPELRDEIAHYRVKVAELEQMLRDPRTGMTEEASNLASGDETYALKFDALSRYRRRAGSGTFRMTWNDLTKTLGPLMFDEASQHSVKSHLDSLIEREDIIRDDPRYEYVSVNAESVNQIIVQLVALGLIEKSIRKRAVSDKATYWSLTPFGERQVMLLNAIRSSDAQDLADDSIEEEEEEE